MDLVAVVGEDYVDEVLAYVVHVALHGRQDDLAPPAVARFGHVRLEVRAQRVFITSADWRTNGSCMRPEPNSSPTVFMPAISGPFTMSSAAVPFCRASSSSASRPSREPSTTPLFKPAFHRPVAPVFLGECLRVGPFENAQQLGQRVVAGSGVTAVVDQVQAYLYCLRRDPVERDDAGRVDDGRVQAGLLAFVEEHRVERLAGRGGRGRTKRWKCRAPCARRAWRP